MRFELFRYHLNHYVENSPGRYVEAASAAGLLAAVLNYPGYDRFGGINLLAPNEVMGTYHSVLFYPKATGWGGFDHEPAFFFDQERLDDPVYVELCVHRAWLLASEQGERP